MSSITQRGATGPLALQANGVFQTSNDASLITLVGSRWDLSDGREVVLVSAALSTTVAAGKLYASAATVANHQNLTVTAVQAYSANGNIPAKVTVTLGGTAATAAQYSGGLAIINAGTGLGQTLKIASNPAQASTTGALVLTLEDGPNTALDTTSKVCLIPAQGAGVVINPATASSTPIGLGLYPITSTASVLNYGFLVSKGVVSALADGAITVGLGISPSGSIAGAVVVAAATLAKIGRAYQAGVDTEYRAVYIDL